MKHNRIVRREFSKQAAKFGEQGLTLSSQDILNWIVENLPLEKDSCALDVAAGTGHLSRAIAFHVQEVIAIDITREVLIQARQENTRGNINNISVHEGTAENLPYQAESFDLVVSRLAIHHFENPIAPLREMVRVCKQHHRIGIIDLLAPKNERIGKIYNHLERLRDPSHTLALSKKKMETMLVEAGIFVEKIEARNVEVDFQRWVQMTRTKPESIKAIRQELTEDINDGSKTGMRPFIRDGSLKFLQVWSVFVGTKKTP